MIEEEIPSTLAGERLDRVVAMLADLSRSVAGALIDGGFVTVDGAREHGKLKLREGQRLCIDLAGVPVDEPLQPDAGVEFGVIHEDPAFVVIDKPAGLVVHPATGNETGTLANGLLARYPEISGVGQEDRPGIVHRLDAGTSGLLVIARIPEAYDYFVDRLKRHMVGRVYTALAWGSPESNNGVIDAPIGRDQRDPLKMSVSSTGRSARTHFEVDRRFARPACSLMTCRLETGRTHQIRVHLTAIGHPVVADSTYGGRRPTMGLTRPFLHARRLEFAHPVTGDECSFDSALPGDLAKVLAELERAD